MQSGPLDEATRVSIPAPCLYIRDSIARNTVILRGRSANVFPLPIRSAADDSTLFPSDLLISMPAWPALLDAAVEIRRGARDHGVERMRKSQAGVTRLGSVAGDGSGTPSCFASPGRGRAFPIRLFWD